jgi:hypothetical protein
MLLLAAIAATTTTSATSSRVGLGLLLGLGLVCAPLPG